MNRTLPITERTCSTCGETFPGKGRARFCSGRCRKAQYGTPCTVCGAPTSGSEGRREAMCVPCGQPRGSKAGNAVQVEQARPRREQIAERWREGATVADLAEEFGIAVGTVGYHLNTMRAQGWDLPYRHIYPKHVERVPATKEKQGREL